MQIYYASEYKPNFIKINLDFLFSNWTYFYIRFSKNTKWLKYNALTICGKFCLFWGFCVYFARNITKGVFRLRVYSKNIGSHRFDCRFLYCFLSKINLHWWCESSHWIKNHYLCKNNSSLRMLLCEILSNFVVLPNR